MGKQAGAGADTLRLSRQERERKGVAMQSWEPYLTITFATAPYDTLVSYGVTVEAKAEWVSIPNNGYRLLEHDGRPAYFDLQLYAGSMCFYLRRRRKAGYSVKHEAEGVQAVYLPNATEPIFTVSQHELRINLRQLRDRG